MSDRTLREKAAKLQQINSQIAALEEQADKLKTSITQEMAARAVDEIKAGNAIIRWKAITSTRFDAKALKEAHSSLYEQFSKPSVTRRFTLVPA